MEQIMVLCSLFIKLVRYIIVGTQTWIVMFVRLILFVVILIPGWIELLRFWIFDPSVIRNLQYGRGYRFRNVVDIYLPPSSMKYRNKISSSSDDAIDPKNTVIVLMSGGAWIIGYKLWSALIARSFSRLGLVVVVPDYRNFPQGDIEDMCEDLRSALIWVVHNAPGLGGDPDSIVLCGQSAGAHIGIVTLLGLHAMSKDTKHSLAPHQRPSPTATPSPTTSSVLASHSSCSTATTTSSIYSHSSMSPTSSLTHNTSLSEQRPLPEDSEVEVGSEASYGDSDSDSDECVGDCDLLSTPSVDSDSEELDLFRHVRMFVGISGPYDLLFLQSHLHHRGLDASILDQVCRGDVRRYSPIALVSLLQQIADADADAETEDGTEKGASRDRKCALKTMPPVALFHGCQDKSVPASVSIAFARTLRQAGVRTSVVMYSEWSHTDAILEGPLGGDDRLSCDVVSCIRDALRGRRGPADRRPTMFSVEEPSPPWALPSADSDPDPSDMYDDGDIGLDHDCRPDSKAMVSPLLLRLARYVNPF